MSRYLFAVFGGEDRNPPVAMGAELKKRATAAVKDMTTNIYREACRAFLAGYQPSYREKPAFEAWTGITDYFGRHLK